MSNTTYRVTRNGALIASGLSAGRLLTSNYQDDPECEIVEEAVGSPLSTPVTQYDVDHVLAGLRRGDQPVSHEIVARMWAEVLQRRGS